MDDSAEVPIRRQFAAGTLHSPTLVSFSSLCRILLVFPVCLGFLSPAAAQEKPPETPSEPADWSGTVTYDRSLLVLTTAEQAALVRFLEPTLHGSRRVGRFVLPYEWRTMTNNGTEQSGTGRLIEDYRRGRRVSREPTLSVGEIRIRWTGIDDQSGNYTFAPRRVQVQQIDRAWYEKRIGANELQPGREAATLHWFLESSSEVTQFFRTREYTGPHTEPSSPRAPLTTSVEYEHHGLVIATPDGVAAIHFGEPLLENDGNAQRTGIRYRYRFLSAKDDSTRSGADEVWEVTVDGKNDYQAARHFLEAGPIHIPWSMGGSDSGWIYFDPAFHTVSMLDPQEAAAVIEDPEWQHRLTEFEFVERPPAQPPE